MSVLPAFGILLICLGFLPFQHALPAGTGNVVEWSYEEKSVHLTQRTLSSGVPDGDSLGSVKCSVCKNVIRMVENLITTRTKAGIEHALEEVCDKMPPVVSSACKVFVEEFSGQIIDMLLMNLSPDVICRNLRLCSSENSAVDTPVKTEVNPAFETSQCNRNCRWCKAVLDEVKHSVRQPSKIGYMKELGPACRSTCEKRCLKYCLNQTQIHGEKIAEMLMKDRRRPSKQICDDTGLCAGEEVGLELPDRESLARVGCSVCKNIIGMVENLITSRTKAGIEHALEEVCDKMPAVLSSACKIFVEEFSGQIIDMLLKNLSPDVICRNLGFCSSENTADDTPVETEVNPVFVGSNCDLCLQIVNTVKSLAPNKTKEGYEGALRKFCTLVPPQYQQTCEDWLNKYMETLVNLLIKGDDSKTICATLGFCSEPPPQVEESAPVTNPKCRLCTRIINIVKEEVKNCTREAFTAAVKKVCDKVPKLVRPLCKKIVDKSLKEIVDMLMKKVDTEKICKALHLCSTDLLTSADLGSSTACEACQIFVSLGRAFLTYGTTEKYFKDMLTDICNRLEPTSLIENCTIDVKESLDKIIKTVKQFLDPGVLCKVWKVCPSSDLRAVGQGDDWVLDLADPTEAPTPLLGEDDPCLYGPSYWCQSSETIQRCKTSEFCTIWKLKRRQ